MPSTDSKTFTISSLFSGAMTAFKPLISSGTVPCIHSPCLKTKATCFSLISEPDLGRQSNHPHLLRPLPTRILSTSNTWKNLFVFPLWETRKADNQYKEPLKKLEVRLGLLPLLTFKLASAWGVHQSRSIPKDKTRWELKCLEDSQKYETCILLTVMKRKNVLGRKIHGHHFPCKNRKKCPDHDLIRFTALSTYFLSYTPSLRKLLFAISCHSYSPAAESVKMLHQPGPWPYLQQNLI